MGNQHCIIKKNRINYNNPLKCSNTISSTFKKQISNDATATAFNRNLLSMESESKNLVIKNTLFLNNLYNYFYGNEKTLCDDYYVFYNAWSTKIQLLVDIYFVYDCIQNNKEIDINRRKLRIDNKYNTITEFKQSNELNNHLSSINERTWFDSDFGEFGEFYRNHFIPVNISLHGSSDNLAEDTFYFFAENKNYTRPDLHYFYKKKNITDRNKIKSFENDINAITSKYYTGLFGIYNQIFIKKNAFSSCVYLCSKYGIPLYEMDDSRNELLLEYTSKNNKEKINELMNNIDKNISWKSYFLRRLNIGEVQARILTGDVFENNSIIFSSDNFLNNKPLYYAELINTVKKLF